VSSGLSLPLRSLAFEAFFAGKCGTKTWTKRTKQLNWQNTTLRIDPKPCFIFVLKIPKIKHLTSDTSLLPNND
jgi:hypothetical protein